MRLGYTLLGLATLAIARVPEAAPTDGVVTGTVKFLRGGKETAVTDGFVYLVSTARRSAPAKPWTATIVQKNRTFSPRRLVVPIGSTVTFPNNDREAHNVFSPSNPVFDLQKYGAGESRNKVFPKLGEFDIYCDLHVDMNAKVKVVESNYIAPVVNGTFKVTGVPAGKYKVVAWAPDSLESKEEITVIAGAAADVPQLNVQLGVSNTTHRRKDGEPYPPYSH